MMDKIVAVISHRDYVLIFKESGKIYRMDTDDILGKVKFVCLADLAEVLEGS